MRFITPTLTITLALALSAGAPAQNPQSQTPTTKRTQHTTPSLTRHRRTPAPAIRIMLHRPVKRVSWNNVPLAEVFRWLRAQCPPAHPVSVVPRWRALAREGIDAETTITLELENTIVADVLFEVLDQISRHDPIVFQEHGNVLRISTTSNFRKKLYTRTYNIAEILFKARAMRVKPGLAVAQQSRVGRAVATPGGVGGTGDNIDIGKTILGDIEDDDDDPAGGDETIQEFIDWIKTTIEPDAWDINGGDGTITIFDDLLFVRNSADVHTLLANPFHPKP